MKKYNQFNFRNLLFEERFLMGNLSKGPKASGAVKAKPAQGPTKDLEKFKAEVKHKYDHFKAKAEELAHKKNKPAIRAKGEALKKVILELKGEINVLNEFQRKKKKKLMRATLTVIDARLDKAIAKHKFNLPKFGVEPKGKVSTEVPPNPVASTGPKAGAETAQDQPSAAEVKYKLDEIEKVLIKRRGKDSHSRAMNLPKYKNAYNTLQKSRQELKDAQKIENTAEKQKKITALNKKIDSATKKQGIKIKPYPRKRRASKAAPTASSAPSKASKNPAESKEASREREIPPTDKAIGLKIKEWEGIFKAEKKSGTPNAKLKKFEVKFNKIKADYLKAQGDETILENGVRLNLGKRLDAFHQEIYGKKPENPLVTKEKPAAPKAFVPSSVPRSRRNDKMPKDKKTSANKLAFRLQDVQANGLGSTPGDITTMVSSLKNWKRKGNLSVAPIPGGYTAVKVNDVPSRGKHNKVSFIIYDKHGDLVVYRTGNQHDWVEGRNLPKENSRVDRQRMIAEIQLNKALLEDAASRIIEHPKGNIKFKDQGDKADFTKALKKLARFTAHLPTWQKTIGKLRIRFDRSSAQNGKYIIRLRGMGKHLSFDTSGGKLLLGNLSKDNKFVSPKKKTLGIMNKTEKDGYAKVREKENVRKKDIERKKAIKTKFTTEQNKFKKTLNPSFKKTKKSPSMLTYPSYKEGAKNNDPQSFTVKAKPKFPEHARQMKKRLKQLLQLSKSKYKGKVVMISLKGGTRKGRPVPDRKAMLFQGVNKQNDPLLLGANGVQSDKRASFYSGDKITIKVMKPTPKHLKMLNRSGKQVLRRKKAKEIKRMKRLAALRRRRTNASKKQ